MSLRLRLRALRLLAHTEDGEFGRDLRFDDGLVVLRADSTQLVWHPSLGRNSRERVAVPASTRRCLGGSMQRSGLQSPGKTAEEL